MYLPFFRSVGSLFVATLLALGCVGRGEAATILIIDITNPAATVLSATGAFAQNDDSDTWLQEGFTLLGIFNASAPDGAENFESSSLRSPGGNFAYTSLFVVTLGPDWDQDLNIAGSGFSSQDFSTTAPAFTGSAIADFSAWIRYLTPGAVGNILAGDPTYNTEVIGQYMVVPEPGSGLFLAMALVLLGVLRGIGKFRAAGISG